MARKVYISVLGTGLYSKCQYIREDAQFESDETFFIQSATLQYINAKDWTSNDLGLILLTGFARKSNWDKAITKRLNNSKQEVDYEGLESVLQKMNLPFKIKDFPILDGNNEEEIWKIFTSTFNELNDGDELYFDVTHAFRFLPMLILVLCDYAKFLKNVTIKSITYGNYEARNKENNKAPIIDLLSLSQLQDWTYAAGTYLDSGNVNKLVEMSSVNYADYAEKLKETIADFHTCRGISIIESSNIKQVKTLMDSMDTSDLPPLKFIFDKVKADFCKYDDVLNVKNGYESAKWCYKNQLYQQAITILIETVISDVCLYENLDWKMRANRDAASNSLFICSDKKLINNEIGWIIFKREDKDKYQKDYLELKNKEEKTAEEIDLMEKYDEEKKFKPKFLKDLLLYRQLVASRRVKELVELSSMIKDVRDDIDHAGMRNGARSFSEIETKLKEIFTTLNTIVPCS